MLFCPCSTCAYISGVGDTRWDFDQFQFFDFFLVYFVCFAGGNNVTNPHKYPFFVHFTYALPYFIDILFLLDMAYGLHLQFSSRHTKNHIQYESIWIFSIFEVESPVNWTQLNAQPSKLFFELFSPWTRAMLPGLTSSTLIIHVRRCSMLFIHASTLFDVIYPCFEVVRRLLSMPRRSRR